MQAATSVEPCRSRATAMLPDDRRAAIAAVTLPLLLEHGRAVTTRQIAEAAGIAEGTMFRHFRHKDEVIAAAVDLAFDPAPLEKALSEIDRGRPLEDQLADAVTIIERRLAVIWRLASAVGEEVLLQRGQ